MDHALFRPESPAEYFKALVETAIDRQHVHAHELTAYYLVNLLCAHVRLERQHASPANEPLAIQLGRALESGGVEQRARLRQLGDVALFVSGFFSDSLRRQVVDVDYYASMGEYAYASLSRAGGDTLADTFAELADRFGRFVDVLNEVSEQSGLTSNADLFRVYERWLRTGSDRDGRRLAARGVVPNASIGKRFIQ